MQTAYTKTERRAVMWPKETRPTVLNPLGSVRELRYELPISGSISIVVGKYSAGRFDFSTSYYALLRGNGLRTSTPRRIGLPNRGARSYILHISSTRWGTGFRRYHIRQANCEIISGGPRRGGWRGKLGAECSSGDRPICEAPLTGAGGDVSVDDDGEWPFFFFFRR